MTKHLGEIEEDFTGTCTAAKCTCGWEAPLRESAMEAQADLDEHYKLVISGQEG